MIFPLVLIHSLLITISLSQSLSNQTVASILHLPTTSRSSIVCNPHFPSFNGRCTNPFFRTFSASHRAASALSFTHTSLHPNGQTLPSARFISNTLSSQSINIPNRRGLNELTTFFGQFLDHTIVATPTGAEHFDIPIPSDDPVFANFSGKFEFRRSVRVPIEPLAVLGGMRDSIAGQVARILSAFPSLGSADVASVFPASRRSRFSHIIPSWWSILTRIGSSVRPLNELSSALDLSSIYGIDETRRQALRSHVDGKLKMSSNNLLPLNTFNLRNSPINTADYFISGDHRVNENPVLTALHTIFAREHNSICDDIKGHFGHLSDDSLYALARRVNIAQFQKIVFEEYYPAMTDFQMPRYRGFKWWKSGDVLNEFSTAAFRVGHTMVGNEVHLRGLGGLRLASLPFTSMFFRTANAMPSIDNLVRGAVYEASEEIDLQVHDSIRNFLFLGIPEEGDGGKGFDLVALNIQRGRDHNIPSFNSLRRLLQLPVLSSFSQLTDDVNVQSRLQTAYGDISRVEAWAGMLAETKSERFAMGETMFRVWKKQFSNLRDADWFHYRRLQWGGLSGRLNRIDALRGSASVFKQVLLRNSEITSSDIGDRVFYKI